MSDAPASLARQLIAAERSRPLGAVQLVSGRTLQPFSRALHDAADNLLVKASAALEEGDEERATRYVSRAAALQYDEHEDARPAVWSAFMALYEEVVDSVEVAGEGEITWLTTALVVLEQAEGAGAAGLRHVLGTISQEFKLEPKETKLVRRAVGPSDEAPDYGLNRDSSAGAVRDVVMGLLRVNLAYHMALYH